MDIEIGSAGTAFTSGTGSLVSATGQGPAQPICAMCRRMPVRTASAFKWMHHPRGDTRGHQPPKPISEGRTMISEYGRLHLQFSTSATFAAAEIEEHVLINQGDFCISGAGLLHRAFFLSDSTVLTLRWGT